MNSTAYMGIVTGAILKYLSSVVKAFTSSASLVITSIISAFVLNTDLSLPFDLAVINLSIAIYLYKTAPIPKPEEEKAKRMNELPPAEVEMEELPSEMPGVIDQQPKEVADSIEIGEDEEQVYIRKFKT